MVYDAPRVRAALLAAAGDRDAHVRMWAAFSLGEVANEAALPVLAELAKDPMDFVATMATEAIRKIENR
jgi:HEAT repeat protein